MLLIEDAVPCQNQVRLVVGQDFPQVELHVADEAFVGRAGVPVVHKPELVARLPDLLADALGATAADPAA